MIDHSVLDTVFPALPQYLLTCLVLVGAELVYVLFGFGSGLIAVGLLAVVLPELRDVVVLILLVNLPPELFVVSRSRRLIQWRGVAVIGVGVALGIPLGTWVLRWGEPTFLLTALGVVLVVAGAAFLLVPAHRHVRWPGWVAAPVGLLSGFLAGTFGTGGPPLILYYQLAGHAKAVFRGNLMAIFLLVTMVRLPVYALAGLVTVPRLWSALAVAPAVLLGAWLGHRIHLEVDQALFRRLVSAALIILGVLQLV
jgi:uncharacterized membrane protein YfcA